MRISVQAIAILTLFTHDSTIFTMSRQGSQELPASTVSSHRFFAITHEEINRLEAEYMRMIDEAINKNSHDFVFLDGRDAFLGDLDLLRHNQETINNAWLAARTKHAERDLLILNADYTNLINNINAKAGTKGLMAYLRTNSPDQALVEQAESDLTIAKRQIQQQLQNDVRRYMSKFNSVYKQCQWTLIHITENNRFMLIDPFNPLYAKYAEMLPEHQSNYNFARPRRTDMADQSSMTEQPRMKDQPSMTHQASPVDAETITDLKGPVVRKPNIYSPAYWPTA